MAAGRPDMKAIFTAERKNLQTRSEAIKARDREADTASAESVGTVEDLQDANHDDTNAVVAGASIGYSPQALELTKAD